MSVFKNQIYKTLFNMQNIILITNIEFVAREIYIQTNIAV